MMCLMVGFRNHFQTWWIRHILIFATEPNIVFYVFVLLESLNNTNNKDIIVRCYQSTSK